MQKTIPIVYSTDDNFINLCALSVKTIKDYASDENIYKIYIFNNGLKENSKNIFSKYISNNFTVDFIDVGKYYEKYKQRLCVRDNYSEAIYYRLLIPSILPNFDKIIYVDCDTILCKDIAGLYDIDLCDKVLGVTVDESVASTEIFQEYTLKYLNIEPEKYFNSGVILFNALQFRKQNIERKFIELSNKISFRVAPDQDFLNVLCYGKVKYISKGWNKTPVPTANFDEKELNLIHYNLTMKPWKFDNVLYADYFWNAVRDTEFNDYFINLKKNIDEKEIQKANYNLNVLIDICKECINSSSPLKQKGFLDGIRD